MKYWQPLGTNKLKHVLQSDRSDGKTMSTNVLMPSSVGPMMGLLEWLWVWARISWFWACTWAPTFAFAWRLGTSVVVNNRWCHSPPSSPKMSPWCLYCGDAAAGTCSSNVEKCSKYIRSCCLKLICRSYYVIGYVLISNKALTTLVFPVFPVSFATCAWSFEVLFPLPSTAVLLQSSTASWIQSQEKRNQAMSHVDIRCPPHRPSWPAG